VRKRKGIKGQDDYRSNIVPERNKDAKRAFTTISCTKNARTQEVKGGYKKGTTGGVTGKKKKASKCRNPKTENSKTPGSSPGVCKEKGKGGAKKEDCDVEQRGGGPPQSRQRRRRLKVEMEKRGECRQVSHLGGMRGKKNVTEPAKIFHKKKKKKQDGRSKRFQTNVRAITRSRNSKRGSQGKGVNRLGNRRSRG